MSVYGGKCLQHSLGWQGGARAGHRSAGGQSLLPVVAGKKGVVASLYVEADRKP